ncbi:unnamed protein product [Schistosoma margrebowiei]|uniref:Uncharacterized protein n=1 Tax=Schistosoma margrebowiei TaxID=48269 RepID=A0A183MF29_9TREM|nr:unnamed protein product [Schistosoma margrebowiei]
MMDNWKGIEETLSSTCQEGLNHKNQHHAEWVSIETLDMIQERKKKKKKKKKAINSNRTRTEKFKAEVEYTVNNKQVKKSIRVDKQNYVEDLAMTVEKSQENEIRDNYMVQ